MEYRKPRFKLTHVSIAAAMDGQIVLNQESDNLHDATAAVLSAQEVSMTTLNDLANLKMQAAIGTL